MFIIFFFLISLLYIVQLCYITKFFLFRTEVRGVTPTSLQGKMSNLTPKQVLNYDFQLKQPLHTYYYFHLDIFQNRNEYINLLYILIVVFSVTLTTNYVQMNVNT